MVSCLSEPSPQLAAKHEATGMRMLVKTAPEQLIRIAKLVDAAMIKPKLEVILPLDEARKAHELSQGGHVRGKIVLEVEG